MIKKTLVVVFLFMMIGFWLGLPIVGYLMYIEPPPANYTRREVLTKEVPPGGEIRIRITADLTKRCNAIVYRSIVDGIGVPFAIGLPVHRTQETDYVVKEPIPLGASPGEALFLSEIHWSCNIIQNFFPYVIRQRALPFTITPLKDQSPLPRQQGVYEPPTIKSEIARVP